MTHDRQYNQVGKEVGLRSWEELNGLLWSWTLFYIQEESMVVFLNRGEILMELDFRKFNLEMASKMNKERKELIWEKCESFINLLKE